MLNFLRRLTPPKSNTHAFVPSAPVSPSKSLRQHLKKYVADSAIELAPEVLPEFVNPTVPPTGAYRVEVVGGSSHQPALLSIIRKPIGPDAVEWEGIAQLVAEPDHPFDPNRVKVVIQEMAVGYLAEDLALRLQRAILVSKQLVTVRAKLTGGFRREDGTEAPIGVLLDFDRDAFVIRPVEMSQA